jgi:D-serine dehydratase
MWFRILDDVIKNNLLNTSPYSHQMVKTIQQQAEQVEAKKICGINFKKTVEVAHDKIKSHLKYTRVLKWKNSNLFLKMESEQVTGSFKARGGGYKVLSLNNA